MLTETNNISRRSLCVISGFNASSLALKLLLKRNVLMSKCYKVRIFIRNLFRKLRFFGLGWKKTIFCYQKGGLLSGTLRVIFKLRELFLQIDCTPRSVRFRKKFNGKESKF